MFPYICVNKLECVNVHIGILCAGETILYFAQFGTIL